MISHVWSLSQRTKTSPNSTTMTTRFSKFSVVFLVLLLVEVSQARWGDVYEIDGEIVDIYEYWHLKKAQGNNYELTNEEEVKSTYICDLHAKLIDKYGVTLMWRIDVFICLCFSLMFTDLVFTFSFCIVSRCSARVSKPIRCYA